MVMMIELVRLGFRVLVVFGLGLSLEIVGARGGD